MMYSIRTIATGLALFALALPVFGQNVYPMKNQPTISYWMNTNTWSVRYANFGDTPIGKALQAKSGINVKFSHPAAGQATANLNLLIASGEIPDIVENDWFNWPGGPEKALKEGYIIRLNEAFAKWAPNLMAYLKAHPEVDKMVKTDDGDYYCFPFIRGADVLMTYQGPALRKDWLDELKLPVPTTIDEWTAVLTAFKNKKGATAPLSIKNFEWNGFGYFNMPAFVGAFGIQKGWYVDKGKVMYGPAQPSYKDFVALMRKWYAEGLLDPDIAMVDGKLIDSKVVAGKTGASVLNAGGGIGYYANLMKDKDPKFRLVAAPYPTLKKGEKPLFGQRDPAYTTWAACAISGRTKNLEAAVRFLDYGFSQEGHMLYNFGTEGVSYNMVNGYPKYSELITANPEKLSMNEALSLNCRGQMGGPFVQDERYIEQYLALPEQKAAIKVWAQTDMAAHQLPLITPSAADASEMSRIMNEVNTYVAESFIKMVLGVQPLTDFPKFQEQLTKLKIDRAIAIQQAAYDRFNKR